MTEDPERPTLCSKKPKATKTKPGAENYYGTQEQHSKM